MLLTRPPNEADSTRFLHEAVARQVERPVMVDPNQFQVISRSLTDPNDTRNLALYLAKDLLAKCA